MSITHPALKRFMSCSKPCILVGAGISYEAPTNAPLFDGLRNCYLNAIDPNQSILRSYSNENHRRIYADICDIQPEQFFTYLVTAIGPHVLEPLDWMNHRPLNKHHHLLNSIVDSLGIQTVLTTNFDRLLERALKGFFGVAHPKSGFKRLLGISDADPAQTQSSSSKSPAIFYLHGQTGQQSLDITNANTSMSYDRLDYSNLAARLSGATLLVVGHGGGDTSDIAPFLTKHGLEEIIWVSHSENDEIHEADAPAAWRDCVTPNVTALCGKTDYVLRAISGSDELGVEEAKSDSKPLADLVSEYLESYAGRSGRHYILAHLVSAVGFGDVAMSILNACEEYSESQSGVQGLIAMRARAIALSKSSDEIQKKCAIQTLQKATATIPSLLQSALPQTQQSRLHRAITRECGLAYESLGVLYYEAGSPMEAIPCAKSARNLLSDYEDIFRVELFLLALDQLKPLELIVGQSIANTIDSYRNAEDTLAQGGSKRDIANYLFENAVVIFDEGRNVGLAIEILELSLRYDSTAIQAYLALSNMRHHLHGANDSLQVIERGLAKEADNFQLLCNKGNLLNLVGRQREAIVVLKEAIRVKNDDPLTWNNLGISLHELGALDEAYKAYTKSVILDPSNETVRRNLDKVRELIHLAN